jgi:hypothetical protein
MWHIRRGEEIAHHGLRKAQEQYSYTISDQDLPKFEWLYQTVLYLIWKYLGTPGLQLIRSFLVLGPLVVLAIDLRRNGVKNYGVNVWLLYLVCILSPFWHLRPHFLSSTGLLLLYAGLRDYCAKTDSRLFHCSPVLLFLWANCHPGVIMGQAMILGAIVCEWMQSWFRARNCLDYKSCRNLTTIGTLAICASFVTPMAFEQLLFPFSCNVWHPAQRLFDEMRPAHSILGESPPLWSIFLVASISCLTVFYQLKFVRPWKILYLISLTILGFSAVRYLTDWALGTVAIAGPLVAQSILQVARSGFRTQKIQWTNSIGPCLVKLDRLAANVLGRNRNNIQWKWLVASVFFAFCISHVRGPIALNSSLAARSCSNRAIQWMKSAKTQGNIFCSAENGNNLIWHLRDRVRVYADTRGFFYPGEILLDTFEVPRLGSSWEQRLERVFSFGTDYLLLETTGPQGELWKLVQAWNANPVYRDASTVLIEASEVRQAVELFKKARLRRLEDRKSILGSPALLEVHMTFDILHIDA